MDWKAVFDDEVISQRLTPFKEYGDREGDVVVCVEASWNEISAEFTSQARSVGIMSVDTEGLLQQEAVRLSKNSQIDYMTTGMGVVWVVATSGEGLTARFDIRRLRKHAWPDSGQDKTFMEVLPETFRDLLVDPSIIKVGSGILDDIRSDFVPIGKTISPVLELQWLVRQARGPVFDDDISMATGLDYVCQLLYGFGYKPVRVKKNVKPPSGSLTYKLYKWPLNLPKRSHNYLRNDSVLPVSLLYRIVKLLDVQADSLKEAMFKICGDLVVTNSRGAACAGSLHNAPVGVTGWALLEQVEAFQLRQASQISQTQDLDVALHETDRFSEDEYGKKEEVVAVSPQLGLLEEEEEMIEASEPDAPYTSIPLPWFKSRKRRLEDPDQFPDHQLCPDSLETSAQYSYGGGVSGGGKRTKNILRNVRKSKLPGPERDGEGNREKTVASCPWFKLGPRCNFCGAAPAWGFYEIKSEDHYQEGYGGVRVEPVKYAALLGIDHNEAMKKVKKYNDAVAEAILAQG